MNCKPGDLAIITNSLPSGALCGRIVRVLRQQVAGEIFKSTNGILADGTGNYECWVIEGDGPLPWCGLMFDERPFPDKWLRPISGVPLEDEVMREIKETA
jgi:hypothetical protein